MDLLNMLAGSMTSDESLDSLSTRSGVSSTKIKLLLLIAIPLLIKKMTANASSQNGAQSLLGALTQHTSQKPVAQQIAEVDQADGEKIIGHILGKDQKELVNALAAQTGVSPEDTAKILASIAPSMLSGLSAATTTASNASNQKDDGFDLSDLAGLFGGQKPAANKPSTGFGGLANLLGGGQQQQQSSSLLGSLFGGGQQQQQQSGSLLGSLLGGSNNASSTSGNALLSSLMSRMK